MRKIVVFFFCITNLYLSYFYMVDIVKYFSGKYNYDGWRYLIPLSIADGIFIFCLIFMLLSSRINKYFWGYVLLAIGHNFAVGTGIENMPFVGFIIVVLTMVYVFRFDNRKSGNVSQLHEGFGKK